MAMSPEDHLKAVLNMIKVTPENYKSLDADMVLYLCEVVAEAEKKFPQEKSAYEGQTLEEMKDGMAF